MQILVTNDDGIDSPGIWALAGALRDAGFGAVTIIAPSDEQSGSGMSFPPHLEQEIYPVDPPDPAFAGIPAFALTGTPAACVTVAMLTAVSPRPDFVVAGINRGLNTGNNVMVSGTVGAAMSGTLWGVPGMAVSLQLVRDEAPVWHNAAWAAARLFPLLRDYAPEEEQHPLVLNVNVPHTVDAAGRPGWQTFKGFRQTTLSDFFYGHPIGLSELQPGPRNGHRFSYIFDRSKIMDYPNEQTDNGAIRAGYVSVTPLAPVTVHLHIDFGQALERL